MKRFGGAGRGGDTYWLWKKRTVPTGSAPRKKVRVYRKVVIRLAMDGRLDEVRAAQKQYLDSKDSRHDGYGRTKRFIEQERARQEKRRREAEAWIERVKARKR